MDFNRSTWTRDMWASFRSICRNKRGSPLWREALREISWQGNAKADTNFRLHGDINYRAELWDEITVPSVNGRVGVIVSGSDCDCVSYYRECVTNLPAGAFIHQKETEHHEAYLDGPESVRYVTPSVIDPSNNHSRDLALEAFEDGHPHVVYV